jgi:RNase P subunit RPR2
MKILKEIHVCRESHLPEDGWFQACFNCYSITSKTFVFSVITRKNKIHEFHVYLCPHCAKIMRTDILSYIRFSVICNKYIRKNYTELFKYRDNLLADYRI